MVAPAITAYRRPLQRVAVVILSMYVLAALIGVGVWSGPWSSSSGRASSEGRDRRVPAPDLGALAAITDAVEAGAGLPEILRAAARALDASLILIDRTRDRARGRRPLARRRALADARRRRRDDDRAEGRRVDRRRSCGCAAAIRSRTPRCCGW